MKVLNIKNRCRSAQSGFTIIELVVVILLLGILTATALPRFMDVTDEAHAAVTEGVLGGLATGMALFHAQWVAEGEVASPAGFGLGNLDANVTGYPEAIDGTLDTAADCVDIFNNVLQAGASTIAAGADIVADNVLTAGDVNGIST
ncbi:MAG: type II secretion system protein, partial [Proteobacteria bacterium]|nr:type II secretion system protein [Pseudomonadota bacterium]